jgi:hypothetical protein
MGFLALVACFLANGLRAASLPENGLAGARFGAFAATDLEIADYAENSLEPEAVWKIKSVSPEHRRLGFFSVKLLPIMVVRDVQLDFISPNPQTNWLDAFRCEWVPVAKRSAFEWRDFQVFFPQEKTPRLQAKRVYPVARAGALIARLEDLTLQAGSRPLHLSRAEVRAEGRAGVLAWTENSATIRWDLFSGQLTTNTVTQGTQNEKP